MVPPSNSEEQISMQCLSKRSQDPSNEANSASYNRLCRKSSPTNRLFWLVSLLILAVIQNKHLSEEEKEQQQQHHLKRSYTLLAEAHIVITRDDRGQSLVLTGEDGKGGKGGKGKGGGDQLVIAGHNMGGDGQSSNMVMQDASNREGDVVINGNSMIVPGEDGHIVLADGRSRNNAGGPPPPPPNLFALWMPYLSGRMDYRMFQMFAGGGGGGGGGFGMFG